MTKTTTRKTLDAGNTLDTLFSAVNRLSKDITFISVQVEKCTIFIPVLNPDEEKVSEFKVKFDIIYAQSQGR